MCVPDTFTLFSKLPVEIQCTIWKLSLQRRILRLKAGYEGSIRAPAELPAALHVSQSSRHAIEHIYPLCFGTSFHDPRIRINFELDVVYIQLKMEQYVPLFLGSRDFGNIHTLAIDLDFQEFAAWSRKWHTKFIEAIGGISVLKKILLVYDEDLFIKGGRRKGEPGRGIYDGGLASFVESIQPLLSVAIEGTAQDFGYFHLTATPSRRAASS